MPRVCSAVYCHFMPPPFFGVPEFYSKELDVYALGAIGVALLFGYDAIIRFNNVVARGPAGFRDAELFKLFAGFPDSVPVFFIHMLGPADTRPTIENACDFFKEMQ